IVDHSQLDAAKLVVVLRHGCPKLFCSNNRRQLSTLAAEEMIWSSQALPAVQPSEAERSEGRARC
ncbi:MAG: hypothetical protein ACXVIG_08035, partial [Halobacteriota archaeon]